MKREQNKKQYEAPEMEILLVKVEGGFAYSEGGAFEDEWGDIITPGIG